MNHDKSAADLYRRPDPLASPSIGTDADLISPCRDVGIPVESPPPSERRPDLAVSLSGGGFRATLAGLGVLRLLADIGRLGSVRTMSSVSGGSFANALFALNYDQLRAHQFRREAFDEIVIRPFLAQITTGSLALSIIFRIASRDSLGQRTWALADVLDKWFFHGRLLEDLDPNCRWIFNASNATTGVRFAFERYRLGDYVSGYVSTAGTGLRLADAVAASSAFPGPLSAMTLEGLHFPCQPPHPPRLLDGGAYDNLGLEAIDEISEPRAGVPTEEVPCIVVLNAGGQFQIGAPADIPIVGDVMRTTSLLYRQTTALRTRVMVERFKVWEAAVNADQAPPSFARRGVLFGLAANARSKKLSQPWLQRYPPPDDTKRMKMALIKTGLSKMNRATECLPLLNRGWWLAGLTLASYHADLLPEQSWPELVAL